MHDALQSNDFYSALNDTRLEMSSLIARKPELEFSRNPFIECKHSTDPTVSQTHKTNPFESESRNSNLKRSVSCDDMRVVLPVIPPLIDLSAAVHLTPQRHVNSLGLTPGFRGNPFDKLKLYRKSFYDLPTQSISVHLSQFFEPYHITDPPLLPPTVLFPNQTTVDKNVFAGKHVTNLSTNPFVSHRPRYSFMSSVVSVMGIESSDESSDERSDRRSDQSSDKTITQNTVDLSNTSSTRDKSVLRESEDKKHFTKNKRKEKSFKIFNKKLSLKQNKKSKSYRDIDKYNCGEDREDGRPVRNPVQSGELESSGDGVEMHALPNTNNNLGILLELVIIVIPLNS